MVVRETGVGYSARVKHRRRLLRQAGSWMNLSIVGIQFPVAIALGFFWGRWMDRHLGTWPYLTAVFSLFGIVAGFVNLFRITLRVTREEEEQRRRDEENSSSAGDDS